MNCIARLLKVMIMNIAVAFCMLSATLGTAQNENYQQQIQPKVLILIPMYLDSAFSAGVYKHGNAIPRYLLPGIEFFNGVQVAATQLKSEGIVATIEVVDYKKVDFAKNYKERLQHQPLVVIAVAQNGQELKMLAEPCRLKNIPFISVTYPNDGGVTEFPQMMLANSTLFTHCKELHKYIQRNYGIYPITMVGPSGTTEDRIKSYFKESNDKTLSVPLSFKHKILVDSFTVEDVLPLLDSNRQNVLLVNSLDKNFGIQLLKNLSIVAAKYKCTVFGMPTWDDLPLHKPEFKGVEVVFSTPFITYTGNPDLYNGISKQLKAISNSNPSDMAFKGYEFTYRFLKTLTDHKDDFMNFVNDTAYKVFTEFNFQPILSRNNSLVDYLENKKIYFIRKLDGIVKAIN